MAQITRYTFLVFALIFPFVLYYLLKEGALYNTLALPEVLGDFKHIFVGILLEALPFIVLGVFFSSLIQVFVKDEWVAKYSPKNPFLGVLFGSTLGLLLPFCECGVIPVARRLIKKGLPAYIGVVFILSVPVINFLVFFATKVAFPNDSLFVYSRFILAFLVATTVGLIIRFFIKGTILKNSVASVSFSGSASSVLENPSEKQLTRSEKRKLARKEAKLQRKTGVPLSSSGSRVVSIFSHGVSELLDMGRYLILGSVLAGLVSVFFPRDLLIYFAGNETVSNVFMMVFAYVISICSTSDAFIASSMQGIFPKSALLSFVVFGPMLDLKNTLMLLSTFRAKFVAQLTLLLLVIVPLFVIVYTKIFF